jgi:hypothetical protein
MMPFFRELTEEEKYVTLYRVMPSTRGQFYSDCLRRGPQQMVEKSGTELPNLQIRIYVINICMEH